MIAYPLCELPVAHGPLVLLARVDSWQCLTSLAPRGTIRASRTAADAEEIDLCQSCELPLLPFRETRPCQNLIVQIPVSREMARRFVAGETLDEAIEAVRQLNRQGMLATLDHLGENVALEAEAISAADEYLIALDALAESGGRLQRLREADPDGAGPGRRLLLRQREPHHRPQAAELRNFVRDRHGRLGIHRAHDRAVSPPAPAVRQRRVSRAGLPAPDAGRRGGSDRRRHGPFPPLQRRL